MMIDNLFAGLELRNQNLKEFQKKIS